MMTFVRFEILQMVNRLVSDRSMKGCSLYSSKRISLPILPSNSQAAGTNLVVFSMTPTSIRKGMHNDV